MELSNAEVFLLVWSGLFMLMTAYLAHRVHQLQIAKVVMMRTLIGMGIGKVKAEVVDGGLRFVEVEEEGNKPQE